MIRLLMVFILSIFICNSQSIVISEYVNASSPNTEATELLITGDNVNLDGFVLRDNSQDADSWRPGIKFKNISLWQNLRRGTIIIINHRNIDSYGIDTNRCDGFISVAALDTNYFIHLEPGLSTTLNLNVTRELLQILDKNSNNIHTVGHMVSPSKDFNNIVGNKLVYRGTINQSTSVQVFPGSSLDDYSGGFDSTKSKIHGDITSTKGFPNKVPNKDDLNQLFWRNLRQPELNPIESFNSPKLLNNHIHLSWQLNNGDSDSIMGYLIIRYDSTYDDSKPLDSKVYSIGDMIGSGFLVGIVKSFSTNTFLDTFEISSKIDKIYYKFFVYRYEDDNSNYPKSQTELSEKARGRAILESDSQIKLLEVNTYDLLDVNNIIFKQGWNLVSSYVAPEIPDSLQYVTAELNPNLVIMKRADGKIFMPGGINQIGKWDIKFGYQAYLTKADTLGIIGTAVVPENTPVYLNNGWSIIPYLRNAPMSIVTALASITDAGRLVIVKRADGKIYMPGGVNQIGNQLPGEGYQAYFNAKDTLIYPPNSAGRTFSSNHIDDFDARFLKTDFENTGNNASLILNIDLADNSELAVMNNDNKIVGAGKVVDGKSALAVWGDDESTNTIDGSIENQELRILNYDIDSKQFYEINNLDLTDIISGTKYNKLTYNKDAVLIGKAISNDLKLSVNPNPFSNSTEIIYELNKDCEIELALFDISGRKVLDLANGMQTKGTHKLIINTENLSSGTYNVILKRCGKSVSERVVVVR